MVTNKLFARLSAIGLLVMGLLCMPRLGAAHPMGNFSINHFSALEVHPTLVRLHYVIDMAEIPTFQEMQEYGIMARPDEPKTIAYRERKVEELRQGLVIRTGDSVLPLTLQTSAISFPPGAGDLPTLRLAMVYQAPLTAETGELVYEDRNFPQRVGWKEIVASPHGGASFMRSSVPVESKSKQLTEYATDLLQAPPQDLRAALTFVIPAGARLQKPQVPASAAPVAPAVPEAQTPRSLLTDLVTARQLSPGMIFLSLLIAIGLGAFHALEPGHGKTLVAAYLVGSRGTAWHALYLGLIVTATHTAGVYLLGAVTLFLSHYIVPERLYPWLGGMSGVIITGLGCGLWLQRYAGKNRAHTHPHSHTHNHAHPHDHVAGHQHETMPHAHPSTHEVVHAHPTPGETISSRALLALGVTGGIVPCPAALVVLLSALAIHRVGFGLLLIIAFSVGLAGVLIALGLLMVSARHVIAHVQGEGRLMTRWLPLTSAAVITMFGLAMIVQTLVTAGVLQIRL
jgi:ABC-type nickel/cobalt efflux system permease component RcnA